MICLFAFLIFFPSFKLSFWGDDWLIFWLNKYFHGPHSYGHWTYLQHFLTRYGSQAIVMEFLNKIFGMNPTYFYLSSFLFRMAAAISLYPLLFYLTKNKFATLFGILFFSITTIGLETTAYLPHIPSYISLTFFNLFLYFFLLSREIITKKNVFLSGIFFYLTFVFAPIRMTGLIPFVVAIELFRILQEKKDAKLLKSISLRLLFIGFVFLMILVTARPFFYLYSPTQQSFANDNTVFRQTISGLNSVTTSVISGKYDIVLYPLISFGGMFVPGNYLPSLFSGSDINETIIKFFYFFFLFTVTSILISKFITKINILFASIFGFTWTSFSFITFFQNRQTLERDERLIYLLLGGYVLFFVIYLICKIPSSRLSSALFISISWTFLAFLGPWIFSPTTIFPINQRYLIGSAVGITLLISVTVSLIKQRYLIPLVFYLVIVHTLSTHNYLLTLVDNHSQKLSENIWPTLSSVPTVRTDPEPVIFYVQGDDTNSGIIHDLISYGFPPHMDIVYNLNYPKIGKLPLVVTGWGDVVSAVSDGEIFIPFGYPKATIPATRIYSFKLEGKDKITDITNEVRVKLSELNKKND